MTRQQLVGGCLWRSVAGRALAALMVLVLLALGLLEAAPAANAQSYDGYKGLPKQNTSGYGAPGSAASPSPQHNYYKKGGYTLPKQNTSGYAPPGGSQGDPANPNAVKNNHAPGYYNKYGFKGGAPDRYNFDKKKNPTLSHQNTTSSAPPGGNMMGGSTSSSSSPASGGPGSGSGGGLNGIGLGIFKAVMGFIYSHTIAVLLQKVSNAITNNILSLPAPSGAVVHLYNSLASRMRPGILVGVLILGLLMMVRHTSYDLHYAGFHGLPRLLGVGLAMAFLPQFMDMLTQIAGGISHTFFPNGAQLEHFAASSFKTLMHASGILTIIFGIMAAAVGFLVVLVAFLKNIFFMFLFICGPFALIGSLIPGLSGLAVSWFRGVIACAAIPSLWAIEVGIGTLIATSPKIIFGSAAGAVGSWSEGSAAMLGLIIILWIMWKTPFKVLEWSFESYHPGGGTFRQLARGAVFAAGGMGLRKGIGAAAGAFSGSRAASSGVGGTAVGRGPAGSSAPGSLGKNSFISKSTGKITELQPQLAGFDGTSPPGGGGGAGSTADPAEKFMKKPGQMRGFKSHPPRDNTWLDSKDREKNKGNKD